MEDKVIVNFITIKEVLEQERRRLIDLKDIDKQWWNSSGSNWARKQFGMTLTELTGEIWPNGTPYDEGRCKICGTNPKINEIFCKMKFSFCHEYTCGMCICRNCIKTLHAEIKKVSDKE